MLRGFYEREDETIGGSASTTKLRSTCTWVIQVRDHKRTAFRANNKLTWTPDSSLCALCAHRLREAKADGLETISSSA